MGKNPVAICALCLQERKLAHSHVWPEFFYDPVYDEDGRYVSVTNEPHPSTLTCEKGIREYLLCQECEERLSRYETYSVNVIRRINCEPTLGRPGFELDYEYEKFKLFGISLIWRLHVAKKPGFRAVSVGPNAEVMRKMLLTADPGPARQFPFAVAKMEGSKTALTVMTTPQKTRFRSHHAYLGIGLGLQWVFITAHDAYDIPSDLPFVGFNPRLQVALYRITEEWFVRDLKNKLAWLRSG